MATNSYPPNRRIDELCRALTQGAGAIAYLAHTLNVGEQQMCFIRVTTKDVALGDGTAAIEPLEAALRSMNDAMEHLGDYLNNCDAVDGPDVEATEDAFRAVQKALGLLKEPEEMEENES